MKVGKSKWALVAVAAAGMLSVAASARADVADIIISEVDAGGSSQPYAGDWFELTNAGASAVDVDGWGVVDSHSETPPSTLSDVTIQPGQSAVFMDSSGGGTTAEFESAWFGTNVPAGFTIGTYGPSASIGLGTSGDQVNIYEADLTTKVYGVTWTSDPVGVTLDNSNGPAYTGTNINLSTDSAVGVDGAFASFNGDEVGSPGTVGDVPEPAALSLLVLGAGGMLIRRRRA